MRAAIRPRAGILLQIVIFTLVFLLSAMASSPLFARTWDVPFDCSTIRAGIDSAGAGDTVLVACGTYYEQGIEMKPGVCLRSADGTAGCATIDAGFEGRVFHCSSLDGTTRIEGFTIAHGYATGSEPDMHGSAMYCDGSSLVIAHCIFTDNTADGEAAGIYCNKHASPTLIDCVFSDNSARGGCGMYLGYDCNPTLTDCVFAGNSAHSGGAMSLVWGAYPKLVHCTFSGNSAEDGAVIDCWACGPTFTNCTFHGNITSSVASGAIALYKFSAPAFTGCSFYGNSGPGSVISCNIYCDPLVKNTLIAFNDVGEPVFCYDGSSPCLHCCDIYGNEGGDWIGCIEDQNGTNGNISGDPLFCDPGSGSFWIGCGSPCADAGGCGLIGAWEVGCGPTRLRSASWSSLKAAYR